MGVLRCLGCGTDNGLRAKFCNECGMALPERGPGGIVRGLAERKFLTILFADIHDSTTIIQDLDPEDAMAKLRPVIDLMAAAVRSVGGTVNRIHGDGIMALFGAPVAVDDHALRACQAALLIRSSIAEFADHNIGIRIGVHSGEVVAHFDAGDFAQTYDVSGPAAHLAARLEQAADVDMALISDETLSIVRGLVEVRPRRGLSFKGFDRRVDAWELIGLNQRSRWLTRHASGLSPFVGRSTQLADLRGRLGLASTGSIQLLAIGGEPGTGKSRLLHELVGSQVSATWAVWEADGDATTSHASFAVVRQLLRAWLGTSETASHDEAAEALRARLTSIKLPEGGALALAALLNLTIANTAWTDLDLPARGRLIEASLVAVLDNAQTRRPTILLVEDLHWADAESRDLLLRLLERLPDARIALIVTHRPMAGLPERGDHVLPIALAEFSSQVAERFLDRLLGDHPSVQTIKSQFLASAGHLPFFLEEAVRHLLETGELSGAIGDCVSTATRVRVTTPRSAQAVAASRIDALDPGLKGLVRAASAIGKRFPWALLADVVEMDHAVLNSNLRTLVRRQIFAYSLQRGFVEFRHDFIREAAYGALVREHRRPLHRSIIDAVERRFAAQQRDWTAVLAHHAAQAQLWEKAVDYERKTIDNAMDASAYPTAIAACGRALEHLKHLPRTRESIEIEIDMRLSLRATVLPDSLLRWVDHATRALELAEEIGDKRRQLAAATLRAWALNFGGVPAEAIPAAEKALALAKASRSEAAMCTASIVLGQAHYVAGHFSRVVEAFEFPLAWLVGDRRLTRGGTGTSLVVVRALSAMAHAWKGEFAEARRTAQQAATAADETRRPYDYAMAEHTRGFVAFQEHRYEEAIAAFDIALAHCRDSRLQGMMPLVLTYLGASLLGAGEVDRAEQLLEEALAVSDQQGFSAAWIAARSYLSGVRVLQGRSEQALELAEEACRKAEELGFVGHHAVAVRFLVWARLASGEPGLAAARGLLQQGIKLAEACGARPQLAAFETIAEQLARSREAATADRLRRDATAWPHRLVV
jgi:class 3 adenylate cyclase